MKGAGRRGPVIAGCALIVVANVLTLGAALWNRWGGPRATLEVTEREIPTPMFREAEDTGVELSLVSTDQAPRGVVPAANLKRKRLDGVEHAWFDQAKLRELGFRADVAPTDRSAFEYYPALPRRVAYVVLEYDGPAFAGWLAEREQRVEAVRRDVDKGVASREQLDDAQALLALDRLARSRLFPVDAGLDADQLLRRYPDRTRCLVLPAVVGARLSRPAGGAPVVRGTIVSLFADTVHAPRRFHRQLAPYLSRITAEKFYDEGAKAEKTEWPAAAPPRYRATIAVGRRLEPWLISVSAVGP